MRSQLDTGSAPGIQANTPSTVAIRTALGRYELATIRLRVALGRVLDLAEHDLLAVQHLARAGELTPTQLGRLLDLTSGGTTALVQRLEGRGFVSRTPHPVDRRSIHLRLTAELEALAEVALAPLLVDIDGAARRLSGDEVAVVESFLTEVTATVERHAGELARRADRDDVAASSAPSLRLLS
jgi:DNA-binding MarR family transcriptional regulator